MKRVILILILLSFSFPANATMITQSFYIEVDSYNIKNWDGEILDAEYYPGPVIGSKFWGSVTYNDTNILGSGDYLIGHDYSIPNASVNETQNWSIAWDGILTASSPAPSTAIPGTGWLFDTGFGDHFLQFTDGNLSGITTIYHADISGGLEDEGFQGTDYICYGSYYYWPDLNDEAVPAYFSIQGKLNIPVPEPSFSILLSIMIIALLFYRKNFFFLKGYSGYRNG